MIKRTFDLTVSFIAIIILIPVFILISFLVIVFSGIPVFFLQKRVGRHKKEFKLIKFRTMKSDASRYGLLTVGNDDSRITSIGRYLRKYKLDELPQLFNILKGDMSVVGPRPETPNYVELYNNEQQKVLDVRPGLTDYASLEYIDESDILASYPNPEEAYVNIIMPAKLRLNLKYLDEQNLWVDIVIILKTIFRIFQ